MQITHEEARQLIQSSSDGTLGAGKRSLLTSHLENCAGCRVYAHQLDETENLLRQVMSGRWKVNPLPLAMDAILEKRRRSQTTSTLLVTRTALVGLAAMFFIFGIWQFSMTARIEPGQSTLGAFPVPTPSTQLTSTRITAQACEAIVYKVQEGDTLESISLQFAVSRETIITLNDLHTETIDTSLELVIRRCDSTPTGTIHPPTSTITLTPPNIFASFTPGG